MDKRTLIARAPGDVTLHVVEDQASNGDLVSYCYATFSNLPLMTVGQMTPLDIRRTCEKCVKTLRSRGFELPSEVLPGWKSHGFGWR